MFELLTGKLPFKGDNAVEIAIKQMKEQIPRVSDYIEGIPQSIENIIFKACAKNPKNRYDSVAQMHDDIATSLDESRITETKQVYKYSENEDLEETKVLPNIKSISENNEEVSQDFDETKKGKKMNVLLIILASIVGAILLGISIFSLFFANKTSIEIKIPDVAGLSVVDAEAKLKENGLTVNLENREESSTTVSEGLVIKTEPIAGRTVSKENKITLVVSTGEEKFILENYVGQLYNQVEGKLKAEGILVEKELKTVDNDEEVANNTILEQDLMAGTKLKKGDTVKFIVADSSVEYPDFVEEQWNLEQIEQFCSDNSITLTTKYKETSDYQGGTVLSQSRTAGTTVAKYATLTITISKEPVLVPQTPTGTDTGDAAE